MIELAKEIVWDYPEPPADRFAGSLESLCRHEPTNITNPLRAKEVIAVLDLDGVVTIHEESSQDGSYYEHA
jgi:hypothetical protein